METTMVEMTYKSGRIGEIGKYQSVDRIIQNAQLKNENRNVVNGDIVNLSDCGYIKSSRVIGDAGVPPSVMITNSGIDIVENVAKKIIALINYQHSEDNIQNDIVPIINEPDPRKRTNKIWEYVKAKPELFVTIIDKAIRVVLNM